MKGVYKKTCCEKDMMLNFFYREFGVFSSFKFKIYVWCEAFVHERRRTRREKHHLSVCKSFSDATGKPPFDHPFIVCMQQDEILSCKQFVYKYIYISLAFPFFFSLCFFFYTNTILPLLSPFYYDYTYTLHTLHCTHWAIFFFDVCIRNGLLILHTVSSLEKKKKELKHLKTW